MADAATGRQALRVGFVAERTAGALVKSWYSTMVGVLTFFLCMLAHMRQCSSIKSPYAQFYTPGWPYQKGHALYTCNGVKSGHQ